MDNRPHREMQNNTTLALSGVRGHSEKVCYRAFPGSAMCVQNLDDSRGFAIRITYRISLRSSSLWEPRHPLLKVVRHLQCNQNMHRPSMYHSSTQKSLHTLWLQGHSYPLALHQRKIKQQWHTLYINRGTMHTFTFHLPENHSAPTQPIHYEYVVLRGVAAQSLSGHTVTVSQSRVSH